MEAHRFVFFYLEEKPQTHTTEVGVSSGLQEPEIRARAGRGEVTKGKRDVLCFGAPRSHLVIANEICHTFSGLPSARMRTWGTICSLLEMEVCDTNSPKGSPPMRVRLAKNHA